MESELGGRGHCWRFDDRYAIPASWRSHLGTISNGCAWLIHVFGGNSARGRCARYARCVGGSCGFTRSLRLTHDTSTTFGANDIADRMYHDNCSLGWAMMP